jgi:hypothetical protein
MGTKNSSPRHRDQRFIVRTEKSFRIFRGDVGSATVGRDWKMMEEKDVLGSEGKKYWEKVSNVGGWPWAEAWSRMRGRNYKSVRQGRCRRISGEEKDTYIDGERVEGRGTRRYHHGLRCRKCGIRAGSQHHHVRRLRVGIQRQDRAIRHRPPPLPLRGRPFRR